MFSFYIILIIRRWWRIIIILIIMRLEPNPIGCSRKHLRSNAVEDDVTFYVTTAFATANVRMLRLKQIRYIFLHIYAWFSIRTYVAVFLNKRLRQCYGRKFESVAKCWFQVAPTIRCKKAVEKPPERQAGVLDTNKRIANNEQCPKYFILLTLIIFFY